MSGTSSETRGYAQVVDVEELTIVNHAGEEGDLRAVFVEIEVTNSIFEPGIQGSVLIYDALGLINRLPIVGEERLKLRYKTPENREKKGEFVIWRIGDEYPDEKGNSSTYRLYFCSPELLENARSFVSHSYTNTDDVMSIVEDIMGRYLGVTKEVRTRNPVIKDPAKVLVIPTYRPIDAIDMLRRRAYTDEGGSDYFLFFERFDAWYFTTLDRLVQEPINNRETDTVDGEGSSSLPDLESWKENWWAYASDKYLGDSIEAKDIRRINVLRIQSRFDSIQKVAQGAYDNEVVQYSIIDKAVTSTTFNHESDGEVLMGGSADRFREEGAVGDESKQRPNTPAFIAQNGVTDSGFAGSQAPKVFFRLKDPEEKEGVVKKSGLAYQSTRVLLEQIRVSITVPGDTMVDVGDIIHLVIPRFDSLGEAQPDKFLYGKYIVANLRDSILAPDKHAMSLDLHRDGYWQAIGNSELEQS